MVHMSCLFAGNVQAPTSSSKIPKSFTNSLLAMMDPTSVKRAEMDQDAGQSPTAAVNSSSAASAQAGAALEGTLCPDPNIYDRSQASEARFFGATSGLLEL
ncbi:general substrate transporter, partial [Colletotrichum scovillei]